MLVESTLGRNAWQSCVRKLYNSFLLLHLAASSWTLTPLSTISFMNVIGESTDFPLKYPVIDSGRPCSYQMRKPLERLRNPLGTGQVSVCGIPFSLVRIPDCGISSCIYGNKITTKAKVNYRVLQP